MELLRTPDERFSNLPGWSYPPRYSELPTGVDDSTLRIAYVDERKADGTADAPVVLAMHGEPSWSYLYRHMIPPLVDAGVRVVAPDLVGFGRSDKPARGEDHTYERHVGWMLAWLRDLDLGHITLVCQDWGGLIGLRLLAAEPDRFDAVVVANTGLPTGDRPPTDAFLAWQRFSQEVETFDCGAIVSMGTTTDLSDEVVAAYNAPYPDDSYCAGPRQFPLLVPTSPDDPSAAPNRAAWEVLERWEKPLVAAFSDSDPITRGGERVFLHKVPGAAGRHHTVIEGGGHFLQEDRGPELAQVVIDVVASTR